MTQICWDVTQCRRINVCRHFDRRYYRPTQHLNMKAVVIIITHLYC